MNKVFRLNIYPFFIILILFFGGCALQHAPGGGPVDREPPRVVFTSPAADSLNLPINLKQIEIHFSESIDRGSVPNNIFISPPIKYQTEWKGWKKIILKLQQPLYDDQTYVISLGSEISDLRKNKMKESYSFAFSTGAVIDQGQISGTVYGLKKGQRVHIFAYLLNDTVTFDPTAKPARYISRTGLRGEYRLPFLKNGHYRILAVEDQNHNYMLDAEYEQVGLPYKETVLDSGALSVSFVDFKMTKIDTAPPQLTSVRAVNHRYFQVRFSEPVLPDSMQYSLRDSLTGKEIPVLALSPNRESDHVLDAFTPVFDERRTLIWSCTRLVDSTGNRNDTTAVLYFKSSLKADTSRFRLTEFTPEDSARAVLPDEPVRLVFSHPLKKSSLNEGFRLKTKGGRSVAGHWQVDPLFTAVFRPETFLHPDSAYLAELDFSKITDLWGDSLGDSLAVHYFPVISARQLGEISGIVKGERINGRPVYLRLRPLRGIMRARVQKVIVPYRFYFSDLPEGKYLLDGFIDQIENGKYDYGRLFPFELSEPFYFSNDTIKVRKRWEKGGIMFTFP